MNILKASVLLGVIALTPASAAAQNFFFRCRGPLTYAVGTGQGTTVLFFVKNATSSGNSGLSLQPGTCAWTDRPISAGEPSKLYWFPENTYKVRASFIAFTACAGNSRCVVEFLTHNANTAADPHFLIDNAYARIYYPAFP